MADYRTEPRKTNDSLLARLRIERGLTQKQLAQMIGSHQQIVARWENGERNPGTKSLKKLAAALECSIDDLME